MKILFVTDLYPICDDEKGIPLTLETFVQGFIKLGCEVIVYRPNIILNVLLRGRKLYKKGIYEHNGVKIYNDNIFLPATGVKDLDKKFIKVFKEFNFDITVAHMPAGVLTSDILKDELKIPSFLSVHSSDIKVLEDFKYSFFFKKRMLKAYKNAKLVLPRSFWLKNKIEKIIPQLEGRLEVAPSGVKKETLENIDFISEKYKAFGTSKIKILTVSSLIKRKNIKSLLKAVELLNEDKKNIFGNISTGIFSHLFGITFSKKTKLPKRKFSLDIIGDGPLKNELVKYASKIPNVDFLGQIIHKEVLEKMKEAHIFILPSLNETFGMVYIEAMAKGCLTVCSQGSGVDGIIKDGNNGFLTNIKAKDIKKTLLKIMYLKRDMALQTAQNALDTACALNEEAAAENYLNKIKMFNI